MRQNPKSTILTSFITTLVVLAALFLLVWFVVLPRINIGGLPLFGNREIVPFHRYFSLDTETTHVIMDDQLLRNAPSPLVESRLGAYHVYLPAAFLRDIVDPFIFWDASANALFISTRQEMLEIMPGRLSFYRNGIPLPLNTPLRFENGEAFLPVELIEGLYPIAIEYQPEYRLVIISSDLAERTVGAVSSNNTPVRYRAESRAPIAAELDQGEEVVVFLEGGDSYFVRVRTSNGLIGYISADDVENIRTSDQLSTRPTLLATWVDNTTPHPPMWDSGPINHVWDMTTNQDANANRMLTPFHHSVNAVSPTWFNFDRDSLRLTSHVSRAYVEWAHAQGVYVWPKVFDVNNATARAILMDREARRTVINQLVHAVDTYNFDGINIDIEHLLNAEEGPYKIQFLRELAIPMRERGIVLSAAVKVPAPWSMFYRRDLIALTVDFVMVMAYDQHHRLSEASGPVASLTWVQQAVINMLEEVPREQLILGLPFFNRAWRYVVLEDGPPGSRAWSMDYTRAFFETRDVEWEWDPEVASYFGEVPAVEDGEAVLWRVWLECPRSIGAKMQIYAMYDLAGVAGWRRFNETEEVWDVIGRHF